MKFSPTITISFDIDPFEADSPKEAIIAAEKIGWKIVNASKKFGAFEAGGVCVEDVVAE